jgi:hypothetical protein
MSYRETAGSVGSVPIGEYLFDPRAANVSIKGQTFAEWYVDEYLFGPTGAGNPNISVSERFRLTPLQNCLFTPEVQWQFQG